MKFKCAHCGEEVFTPFRKMCAGTIKSKGAKCPKCGGYNVNGVYCSAFTAAVQLLAFVYIILAYKLELCPDALIFYISTIGALLLAFLLSRVNMMFFGKLCQSMRTDLPK